MASWSICQLPGSLGVRFPNRVEHWPMISGPDFVSLAEAWVAGRSEAEWRSAVSRAYYGAFHQARRLLRSLGFTVPRADRAHAYLWMRLSNCGEASVEI